MRDFSIKLGFVPTRRLVFDKEEAQKHKNLIRDKLLFRKINLVDIDWLNEDGMLYDIKDVEKGLCQGDGSSDNFLLTVKKKR